jgi:hypothetical protein
MNRSQIFFRSFVTNESKFSTRRRARSTSAELADTYARRLLIPLVTESFFFNDLGLREAPLRTVSLYLETS